MKQITITKVVSRNFVLDMFTNIQNMFGMNLTYYEKMIQKGIAQVQQELQEKNINVGWYRYEISQLSNGAMAILFYGEQQ